MGAEYTQQIRFCNRNLYLSRFIVLITIVLSSYGLKAQQSVQVIWPLTNDAESVYTSGIGHTSFSHGTSLTSFRFDSINGATASGWNSPGLNKNAYFEYTLSPEQDASLTITTLKFDVSLSSVNMRTAVHYSKDGFAKQSIPIGNTVFVGKRSSRELTVETSLTVTWPETLSIRIYGWSAPNPAINFFTRDVEFGGVVNEKETEKVPQEIIVEEETGTEGGERSIMGTAVFDFSGTWTCPANVFKVTVECYGGGGQGGAASGNNKAGGGGGGGGYSKLVDYTVVPGTTYTVTVGAGGTTLANGTLTNGGASWFNTINTVRANGGNSVAENVLTGGAGATVGVGTLVYSGGNGALANTATHGGGGGSSAGTTGNGNPGNLSVGGTAPAGGGNGGDGHLVTAAFPSGAGVDGLLPGGAGGGAICKTGGESYVGGDGANGRVIITFCVIPTAYNVTGGGSFCSGGSGVAVGLSDTDPGISYQLYRNVTTPVGGAINGTGNALSFGNQTIAGTYTVIATNLDGGCTQNMSGSAIVIVNPIPTATISGTATVCQNDASPNIIFTGSNGTTPYIFSYRINGGPVQTITSPAGNPIATLPVPTNTVGTYLYTLVNVSDANGCSSAISGSATVTVNPDSPVQPGPITGNATTCPLLTGLQYSISSVPNATGYTWSVPAGWSITGGQNTTLITVTAGNFGQNGNISVVATNSCGDSPASTLAVTVLPGTPATPGAIAGLANQCPNVSGQIYNISAVTNATNYTWTVPTGWSITAGQGTTSITVSTGNTGQNGNITVTASNSCGTSSPRSLAVNVGAGTPSAPIGINGPTAPCPNTPNLHYSINAVPNATTYTWTVPTGWAITAGQGTLNITVTSGAFGNNGDITVSAGNACGNSSPATLAVTVAPGSPAVPGSISGNILQCANQSGQIYSISPVPNATSYTWTVPSGWNITAGQNTTSITVTTGVYGQNGNITVTASSACGTSAPSILAVTINPGAPATPGAISGTTNHCFQQTGQVYSINAVTNATTYTWTVPTGWSITAGQGTTSITVTTGLPGQNGNISVTAGNICGTSAASSLAVVVSTVPANTSPIFPAPATVCQGATLTFSVTAVAGVTYTWSFPADWTLNSGQGSNQATVTVGTQSGNISVVPSNTCGNGNPTIHAVTVTLLPSNPGAIQGDDKFCQGTIAKYTVTNVAGVSYTWTVPAGWSITSGQGTNTIMTSTTNGVSGNVTVTPSITCGSGPSSTMYVTVYTTPAAETGPDGDLCAGGFTTIGAPPVAGNTYLWTSVPFEAFNHNISNPTVQPFVNTTYTLVETSPDGCTNSNDITITANQVMALTINPPSQEICPGENFTINVTSNILGTTFTWERDNTVILTGMPINGNTVPITGALNSSNPTNPEISTFKIVGLSADANCGAKEEATVTIVDNKAPVITCPVDPVRYTNPGTCSYIVVGNELDPTVTDNCAVILTNNINSGSTLAGEVFDAGMHLVKWTATDPGGLTADCEYNLIVKDDISPSISCVGNQIVNVTSGCTYVHTGTGWDAIATDNCAVTDLTYSLSGATLGSGNTLNNVSFNLGVTTVRWDATDGANGDFCTFTVRVIDNIPPTISCPVDFTAPSSTNSCNASINLTNPVIGDNCAGTTLTWTITGATTGNGTGFIPQPYIFNVGVSTVTYTLTDQAGLSVFCDFDVTITDNTKPQVICPTVNSSYPNNPNQCQATLSFTATATDNCNAIQSIKYYIGAVEIVFPYIFPLGSTTVTVYATDIHGNVSDPCSFVVNVVDSEIPSIICAASPQTRNADDGGCTYTVQGTEFDPVSFSDNCPGVSVKSELTGTSTLAGVVLTQGIHDLIWTVTDAAGNTNSCTVRVTITDGEAPIINCPVNITQNTGPGNSLCGKVVTWTSTGTDNCGGPVVVTCTPASGSTFNVGTTTVTCTGTDGSGNTGTCSFTVTVIDDTPPDFVVPPAYTANTSATCTYDINPLTTGVPTNMTDNCGVKPAPFSPTYTDVIVAVPPCIGSYTVTRKWRVTDIHNNYTEKDQIITIRDNTPPVLTAPSNRTVDCADPIASYGVATATDNCDANPVVSYTDVVVNDPFCASGKVITRTWIATDCSGNVSLPKVQIITVDDNIAPVIDNPGNMIVQCPSMIPTPNPGTVTAHDNCGSVTITFIQDDAQFPPGAPGYCPDWVNRIYHVTDQCGNTTVCVQYIDIIDPIGPACQCSECLTNNSFWPVDLEAQPSVTIYNAPRLDKCCDATGQEECVSFSVYLPPWAVGVQIQVDGGHPNGSGGGNNFWKVDCEEVEFLNQDFVCLPGGNYYLFTYCKPGKNENNNFTFTVMEGIITAPDIDARVSCNSIITANTNATTVTWHSISPGAYGQWDLYLTCLNPECSQVQFTPDANAPDQIVYEVCGTIANMPCFGAGGTSCDQVTVSVHDAIEVTFNVDPGAYCNDEIPEITATVTPSGTTYVLEWYKQPDLVTVLGTGYTYQPLSAGTYVLKVHDMDGTVPCPDYFYEFIVAPDDQPPVITPPAPLELECNDPGNSQAITNWLATATAIDDYTQNVVVHNNYSPPIQQGCNTITTISFTAQDQCLNNAEAFSTITIRDTQSPTWFTAVNALDRTVDCNNAADLQAAQLLEPTATDFCDTDVEVIKTVGQLVPGSCPQSGTITNTWIAVDDCGNQSATVYTQVITVSDGAAPVWTTIAGDLNRNVICSDAAGLAAAQALLPVATDVCDPIPVISKIGGSQVPGTCPTLYTITNTFTATDHCGNVSVVYTQIITVSDNVAPVINTQPSNLTVECDGTGNQTQLNNWLNSNGGAVATDACSAVTWSNNFTSLSDLCGETGAATVIFTAKDACNNSISTNAVTFTIVDTQAPTISCPPDVIAQVNTATCTVDNVNLGTPTVSDGCSAVTVTNNAPAEFPAGVTIVIWTATDACGNSISCNQTVTVQDLIPPTVDCPISPITVNADPGRCDAYIEVPAPVVTDPCPWTMINDYTGTSSAFATYPVGTTTITWTITGDISGAENFCTQVVNVIDNQPPTITCPGNQLFTAPAPACTLVMAAIPDPVISDNCDDVTPPMLSWVISGATTGSGTGSINGTSFNVGVTHVVYTVIDAAGLPETCEFDVTVNDDVPPTVITCPGNQTVPNIAGECFANVTVPLPVVIDPCGEVVSFTNDFNGTTNASGQYPVGSTLVTWTFLDNSGNTSTCQHTITVSDTEAPTITCPTSVTVQAVPPDCFVPSIVIDDPVIDDNCPNPVLTWTKTGATIGSGSGLVNNTPFNNGVTTVRYIITDAAGNSDWCEFTVTVIDDLPPTITDCPDNIIVSNDPGLCSANVTVPLPVVDDPCLEIVTVTNSFNGTSNASGVYPVGTTTVVWTFTDQSNNTSTCSHTVTVNDTEKPLLACPSDVTAIASPPDCVIPDYVLEAPVYSDNCGIASITWDMTGATTGSGSGVLLVYDIEVGVTTITYTVTDVHNNAEECSFTITINDEVPPTIIDCPDDITQSADPGVCNTYIVAGIPVVNDPCGEIVSISHNSPVGTPTDPSGYYDVGEYNIIWTFTDESGNESTCTQVITVEDNQNPVFTLCPSDVLVEATPPDCEVPDVVLEIPEYTDNCPGYSLTYTMTGAVTGSGSGLVTLTTFPVGTTEIIYTVTDASGNFTNCIFQVVVHDDVPPTVITCPPSQDVYPVAGSCEAQVTIPWPTVIDPCGEIVSVTHNSPYGTPADPSGIYPVGVYNITWTFTDESGNIVTCLTVIRVIDNQFPIIECPDDITAIATPPDCVIPDYTLDPPVITDNCNYTVTWSMTGRIIDSGTGILTQYDFLVGTTIVTYTVTDASGNITTCSFTVIINDQVPPTIVSCPADITAFTTHDLCEVDLVIPKPVVDDPCQEIVAITNDSPYGNGTDDASGTYPEGNYLVIWSFEDESGNIDTCQQRIKVIDEINPDLTCPDPITVDADFELPYASNVIVPPPTYWDACGVEHLSFVSSAPTPLASPLNGINIFPSPYTFNVGVTTITYTATDYNGNVSICSFTITVLAEPVIDCPIDIDELTDAGVCSKTLDPGYPVKVSGVEPITWTWTITNQAGDEIGTGTCSPTLALPTCLGSFTFPVGVNTVTWTATNVSGTTSCTQIVTITDDEPPTITTPTPPSFCVSVLMSAVYDGVVGWNADIVPEFPFVQPPFISSWRRPDWYAFNGTNELDVIVTDNCCFDEADLSWTIQFAGNDALQPDISGTGQPSDFGQIILWGSPLNVALTHTITYLIIDCNGNVSLPVTMDIIITPRPNMIKQP